MQFIFIGYIYEIVFVKKILYHEIYTSGITKIKGDKMNDRKQHVIKMAHQLFIEKGFQSTSIQDILDYSGISKGTFYNYFSSKNELLIALIKSIYQQLEVDRKELLIGQDPADIEIFIQQIVLQMKTNRANKLVSLFEEMNFSNDEELKQFIKFGNLKQLRWLFFRFIDLFGESKKPYLLDCAIMFMGILQHNLRYFSMAYGINVSIHDVVRYSVERIVAMVEEVSTTGKNIIPPSSLDGWLPDCHSTDLAFKQKLNQSIHQLKKKLHLNENEDLSSFIELLHFVHDEILHSKNPRKFLIESAIFSMKSYQPDNIKKELEQLEYLVTEFFEKNE